MVKENARADRYSAHPLRNVGFTNASASDVFVAFISDASHSIGFPVRRARSPRSSDSVSRDA